MSASHTDVLVIGGGLTGLVVATRLAEAGIGVTLFEARDTLAPTDRFGFVERGVVEHPHRTCEALGPERHAALRAFTDRGVRWLASQGLLEPTGMLWAATDAREPAALARSAPVVRGRLLDEAQVLAHSGARLGPGLLLPDEGLLVADAHARLAARAREAGAVLHTGAPAETDPDVIGVRVHREQHTAEVLVYTAGFGCAALVPRLSRRLMPVREQGLRTSPLAQGPHAPGRAGQGYLRWRWQPDGSLLASGARWATPHLEVGESEPVVQPRVQARIEDFVHQRFSADAEVVERWGWVTCQSPDQLPIVGPLPGEAQRIVATGFGTSPAAMSVAAADAVVRGLLDGEGEVPALVRSQRLVRWSS